MKSDDDIVHEFAVYVQKNVTILDYDRLVRGCYISHEHENMIVHRVKRSQSQRWPDSGLTSLGLRLREWWFSTIPMPLFLPIRAKRSDELIFVWRGGKKLGRVAFTLWKRT